MRLHLQVKVLKKEIEAYEAMLEDVRQYLCSSKFNKFQESSPSELCDKVQVNDILRRLEIDGYRDV